MQSKEERGYELMKQTMGKFCSLALAMILLMGNSVKGFAATADTEHAEGYIPDSRAVINALRVDENEPKAFVGTLPSSVDLSNSVYFPKIGNQGSIGSCTAFATAYYQFTYEINKLNGVPSNSDSVIASPKYIYNYVNHGINNGSSFEDCYKALMDFGCVSLAAFPYTNTGAQADYTDWCSDTQAMRDALSKRVCGYRTILIDGSSGGTPITGPNDSDLDAMKEFLASGKVLTMAAYSQWDIKSGYGADQAKSIAVRFSKTKKTHAMTIVGYDDNIKCDVNGNGTIEAYEKGAFKIANSWGTSSGQNGYFWVLYDALNGVSANTINNWESAFSGTRCSAFLEDNTCWIMYVENKQVGFIGEFDVTTPDRNKFSLTSGYSAGGSTVVSNEHQFFPVFKTATADMGIIPFSGKLVFDYSKTPLEDYYNGYKWYVRFHSSVYCPKANFAITDSLGNVLSDFGRLPNSDDSFTSKTLNLPKGDVDYSGALGVNDSLQILMYLADRTNLSNVQKALADVNGDGKLTTNDALLIQQVLAGKATL